MQALPAVPHVSAAAAVAAVGVVVHLQQLHAVTPPSAVTPMTPLSASPQAAFGMPARTSPVVLSPLGLVPGMAGLRWRGRVQVFGIRECAALRESGGATMFASRVMWEAFALARAQAAARGANAIIHFAINELRVVDSPQRNTVRAAVMVGFCGGGVDKRDRRTCCLRRPATQCLRPLAQWTTILTSERAKLYDCVFCVQNSRVKLPGSHDWPETRLWNKNTAAGFRVSHFRGSDRFHRFVKKKKFYVETRR
jgi:hypothetical protein